MGSSIGLGSIVTSCLFHPGERITNFCTNKDCLLPLCPKCVKIHTEEHNKMGTYWSQSGIFGDFNTIDESYREAETNLKGSLTKLSELESLLIKIKGDYELKVRPKRRRSRYRKSPWTRLDPSASVILKKCLTCMSRHCLTTNLFKTDSFWKSYIWVSVS